MLEPAAVPVRSLVTRPKLPSGAGGRDPRGLDVGMLWDLGGSPSWAILALPSPEEPLLLAAHPKTLQKAQFRPGVPSKAASPRRTPATPYSPSLSTPANLPPTVVPPSPHCPFCLSAQMASLSVWVGAGQAQLTLAAGGIPGGVISWSRELS